MRVFECVPEGSEGISKASLESALGAELVKVCIMQSRTRAFCFVLDRDSCPSYLFDGWVLRIGTAVLLHIRVLFLCVCGVVSWRMMRTFGVPDGGRGGALRALPGDVPGRGCSTIIGQ